MNNSLLIHASNIKKSFKTPGGDIPVLNGIDLHLHAGDSLSIRGESGSGKTTLLNILTLLERPDSGQVVWENNRVDNLNNSQSARSRAHFLGLIFQTYSLIPDLNVIENVLMPSRILGKLTEAQKVRAKHLLELVGLNHRTNHATNKLSGGEMQRVAIARSLINSPKVIVADEPTGSLDERTAGDVMKLLLQACVAENKALLLVTHNPHFAELTQKQLLLKKGQFV